MGVTLSVPLTRLEHGLVLRPTAAGVVPTMPLWRRSSGVMSDLGAVAVKARDSLGAQPGAPPGAQHGADGSERFSGRSDADPSAEEASGSAEPGTPSLGTALAEPEFLWSEGSSVLWLSRLLEVQRTRLHQRMWKKVQLHCDLPDSEHLIIFFTAKVRNSAPSAPRDHPT